MNESTTTNSSDQNASDKKVEVYDSFDDWAGGHKTEVVVEDE